MNTSDWVLLGECFAGSLVLVALCAVALRAWAARLGRKR